MSLTAEQRRIASLIVKIGRARGEKGKRIVANLETGIVESNLRNLPGGSGSSVGYRQETKSSYPTVNRRNVKAAINRFYDEARHVSTKGRTAGQIAQAVQRSAFPGRYDQVRGRALGLYRKGGAGGSLGSGGGTAGSLSVSVTPGQIEAGNAAVVDLLNPPKPVQPSGIDIPEPSFSAHNKLPVPAGYQAPPAVGAPQPSTLSDQLRAIQQLPGTDISKTTINVSGTPGSPGGGTSANANIKRPRSYGKQVAHFDGKPVAGWIKPWLQYARQHGWKGSVNSGYRSVAEQRRIYNSGVRPAAKPGQSNHNFTGFPGGAIDVSDAAQLSRILKRAGSPLKWAGAKDPVHFSHPRNGTY